MDYNPMLLIDFYKAGHVFQYPPDTQVVYSTWTPRMSHIKQIDKVVVFGFQGFVQEILIDYFNHNFFNRAKSTVVNEYKRIMKNCLFDPNPNVAHIEALHDVGYLPILIKSLDEGTLCPLRVPCLTIENTMPSMYWVTNALETLFSCENWQASTSATIAFEYKKILTKYALETGGDLDFVQFQGHDFSFRGQTSYQSAAHSGAGHLTSFAGTDTVPSILYLENYYNANSDTELVGCSVPASEHSCMSAGGRDNEFETYRRFIQDVYPSGIVSIVSDTWDLWHVITDTLVKLKPIITARDGKVVIRPDSGDPVDIICGLEIPDYSAVDTLKDAIDWARHDAVDYVDFRTDHGEHGDSGIEWLFKFNGDTYEVTVDIDWNRYDKQFYYIDGSSTHSCNKVNLLPKDKGVIELLWDIFGGTVNDKGFKVLDSHIGAIYGDSITIDRADSICRRLAAKGFASTNIVFGIGSFTYQYQTRDTFGFAVKSTAVTIGGVEKPIFKDPITDNGTKKSAYGRVAVTCDDQGMHLQDNLDSDSEALVLSNELTPLFKDGKLLKETSLADIRARLNGAI